MQLTVKDAAKALNVTEKTVYRWIQSGGLPAYRVAGTYRINRAMLFEWATSKRINFPMSEPAEAGEPAPLPGLADALEAEGLAHSGAMRDAWINIAATGVPVSDRVKTTVLKADIGTVLPLADRTLHPDAARQPLTLKQTLPSDWNGLMTLSWSGAMAYWTPTGGTPIVSGSVFSNALLPQIIYLEGDGCGTNEAVFSVVGLSDCKTNLALSIFGMNATLAGVNEADELAPGGFIADRSVHTNAPRTMLTLEACGPVAATGNVVLTWNSSVVQIYTAAAGGSPLAQFIRPYNGFTATNLYVEGIAPGSNTLAWTYSAQTNCADKIKLTVLRVVTETVATTPSDRTRKTVGVGEEVNLRIMPSGISGTWSTSGGNINPAIGNSTFVEVPHVATSITVTVSCGSGVLCDIPFSVLEPSGYLAPVNTPITGYGTNIAGAGMTINLWLPPTNVSFYRVEIVEVEAISTNATGYFANTNVWPAWKLDHGLCGAGAWVPVGMNNYIGTDTANSGACPPPWTDGHFSWPIPGGWRVIGNTPTNNLPWSDQDFTINSNGTVTLLKFGHGVTRATNDVYTVVY